ncbi:MAG: carboxypeptidase-like regulatory domain-containing protein [Bacteroidetes bacterium]|nr:carboxypeptidase-like regulatory domain-containing protein [Bacteroidota bacterium]
MADHYAFNVSNYISAMSLFIKKCICIISYVALSSTAVIAQRNKVSGHVIDRNLDDVIGATIVNLNTHERVNTDSKGHYLIKAIISDTLLFSFVGVSPEKRIVHNNTEHINILLIDRTVNDLGAVWTKKQYRQAERQRQTDTIKDLSGKPGSWVNGMINGANYEL